MMTYSTQITDLADDIVSFYAKYDSLAKCYNIYYNHISSFHIEELCSLLMTFSNELALEAISSDNPCFERYMLPSLIKYLAKSYDADSKYDFTMEWQQGIAKYFEKRIKELLDERLDIFNINHGYTNKHDYDSKRDNGKESSPWL